jgi:NADH-quinone oxidoreductase subunit D
MAEIKNYTLNFGPQHPAAHGVLRLVLELDGEVIQRADPHIGLLHRATEKLAEQKTFIQSVPYMDRLDYVSMMCNEHAYCAGHRALLGIEVPLRAVHPRDVRRDHPPAEPPDVDRRARAGRGRDGVLLYASASAKTCSTCTKRCRARMHAAYYRPGGVYRDLPDSMPQYKASKCATRRPSRAERKPQGSLLDFIDDFTNVSRPMSTNTKPC